MRNFLSFFLNESIVDLLYYIRKIRKRSYFRFMYIKNFLGKAQH